MKRKKKPKIVVKASPDCLKRAFKHHGKPDFTVTSAKLDYIDENAFSFAWETKSAGFGTVSFYCDEAGNLQCDNEGMSANFVKAVLAKFVDGIGLPERHSGG